MSRRTSLPPSFRRSLGAAALAVAGGLVLWLADPSLESRAAGKAATAPLQLAAATGEGRESGAPVVVELFTSQGCSSCPPADALLTELAEQPGVLALEFHVDYWDYIGWKDPFAAAQYTQRQRDYAAKLGLRYIYTPQIVVDGRHDIVGSRRHEVVRAIEQSAQEAPGVTVTLEETDGGRARLSAGTAPSGGATVWLVTFDDSHFTTVERGENRGRALTNSNVVRELTALGTWSGDETVFSLDLAAVRAEGRSGCAVIVQQGRGGPILGAAAIDLDANS